MASAFCQTLHTQNVTRFNLFLTLAKSEGCMGKRDVDNGAFCYFVCVFMNRMYKQTHILENSIIANILHTKSRNVDGYE